MEKQAILILIIELICYLNIFQSDRMTNSDLDLSDAISNSNKNNAADKSERMEALSKLDNAKFGWFHVRACIVSGIGFFTVSRNFDEFCRSSYL